MKILYIAPFYERSTNGENARNYLRCLNKRNVSVCIRPIGPKQDDYDLSSHINSLSGCDTLLIHGEPDNFLYDATFKKCIGITHLSSNLIDETNFNNYFELMDDVILTSSEPYKNCINIEPCFDVDEYKNAKPKENDFIFKFLTTMNPTLQEFGTLVKAYCDEFRNEESVLLTIRTSPEHELQQTIEVCKFLQKNMRRYNNPEFYPPIQVNTFWFKRDELLNFYNSHDCYINTSTGNQWSRPMIDCLFLGKRCISTIDETATLKFSHGVSNAKDYPYGYIKSSNPKNVGPKLREVYNTQHVETANLAQFSDEEVANKLLGVINESQKAKTVT